MTTRPPHDQAANANAAAAASTPSYDDFEPFCNWRRQENQDTLEVHVPDFKREQMKVHIGNRGTLRISGERQIDETKRISRFTKEIKIPKDCNASEISARLISPGRLNIVMPKKLLVTPVEPSPPAQENQQPPQENQQPPKSQGTQDQDQDQGTDNKKPGQKIPEVTELTGSQKVALTTVRVGVVVVAVAVVFGLIGAYATYKIRSSD